MKGYRRAYEALKTRKLWFTEDDLLEPIDWKYIDALPKRVRLGLELYMEGRVSLGKAAEVSGLTVREFDEYRARARVPIRGLND